MHLRPMLLCVLTMLLGSVFAASGRQDRSKPLYEVYALEYAVIPDFPVASLIAGADKSRRLDIAMMVWLLKGRGGRNVLVDSGFYRDKFLKQWKTKSYMRASEAIAKLRLKPEDITDLIITHVHWDHMDGIDLFPNARVWIQKAEYEYYCDPAQTRPGIDADDRKVLETMHAQGRVKLVDGDGQSPIPGIVLYTGGRHTFASQFAGVNTKAGTVVVASDNLYLYENLEKHLPIAQTFDAESNLKAQDRMKTIASALRLIIPGHDPEVFVKFPKPGNGVAKIE